MTGKNTIGGEPGRLARAEHEADDEVRRDLADAIGSSDAELVEGLRLLGFTGETIGAFSLLPLVQTAWADGSVSGPERRSVLEVARLRGLESGSAADDALRGWLDERPPDALFDGALRVVRDALSRFPEGQRGPRVDAFLAECVRVAEASGGVRGFVGGGSNISREEADVMREIRERLLE
jgi:hypothetical protein